LRKLTAVCAIVAAFTAAAAAAAVAEAAPISDCAAGHGTIVAVDFAHWNGPIVRGCAGDQPSGYALLHATGFVTSGDEHDGPGFICRLGDGAFRSGTRYPTPNQDACILTPPASAYWSYWIAPAGQNRWSSSSLGAIDDVPKSGEVELWTFGATNIDGSNGSGVPSFSPNSLRVGGSVSDESSDPRVVAAAPTVAPTGSGSAWPLTIAVCLAVVLCGAAGRAVWRRRQYE
jgi:hypothetical protein